MIKKNGLHTTFGLIVFIGLLSARAGSGQIITKSNSEFSVDRSGVGNVLTFNLPEYTIQEVSHLGSQFHQILMDRAGSVATIEEPDFPSFTTFYAVNPERGYEITIDILDSELHPGMNVLPKVTWEDSEMDPTTPLVKKPSVYTSSQMYPEKMAVISERMVMRDVHIVSVTVTPFQYNPVTQELEVVTSARIELTERGNADVNVGSIRKPSRAFEKLYSSFLVNYERTATDYQKPSVLYIMSSNSSSYESILDVLLEWRREQGFVVNTASMSTIGSSSGSIKNYITNAYNNWADPPEYVVLVGDAGGSYNVPTFFESWSNYVGEGDHPYSTLEGDDYLPELMVGRLSFSNTTELATIVNKIMKYEKTPYMGEDWFTRASLVGDTSPSGISCVTTNEYIREVMEAHGIDSVRTIYGNPTPSQMVNDINDGVAYANYRGYIGMSGFTTGDINSLNNGPMLAVATFITCSTGNFSGSGSTVIEAMIRAGTPSQPKGGVAAIGTATSGTHTMFNNVMNMGIYSGIFIDKINSIGGAIMAGKLNLWKQYPSNPENFTNIFTHWNNLMGDPSLTLWTGTPKTMDITLNSSIKVGTNFFDVLVEDDLHNPLKEARVVLYRENTLQVIGYSDSDGKVTVSLEDIAAGDITVTILKHGYIPYQTVISVENPSMNITIDLDDVSITDDGSGTSSGNGNGLLNGGETIEISAPISNIANAAVSGVYAILSASNSSVTIFTDSVYYGSIGTTAGPFSADPFVIQVSGNVKEDENLGLRITMVDDSAEEWITDLKLDATASDIVFGSVSILDNNDGLINPGETVNINVSLKNSGSAAASNVLGMLSTNSSIIEI